MNLARYQWLMNDQSTQVQDQVTQLLHEAKESGCTYSPAFLYLCVARGLVTVQAIQDATNQEPQLFHDAYLLHDMEKAVERLREAVEEQERILIYGDYDADGITSTLILYEALESIGANVEYYLPNRLTDGYGPNKSVYQYFIDSGVELLLTCDNGIAGHEAIDYAKSRGVDVIVSDHHEIQDTLPNAYAIIHPEHPEGHYPFKSLSGAGVALKIATALLEEVPIEAIELAAIGTVSDMVSLTDENRTIVLSGLKLMADTQRIGLSLLLEREQVDLDNVTTDTIGFTIGPHLNAIGRLGDPTPALQLLQTIDDVEAQALLEQVYHSNDERKRIVENIMQDITQRLDALPQLPNIIVESDSTWEAGVLGIVASRVVERYQRPALLFQYQKDSQWYKGSGRSTANINLFEWLMQHQSLLKYFGGHAQAAGMTVEESKWQDFVQQIQLTAQQSDINWNEKEILTIDVTLDSANITVAMIEEMLQLGPFGMDNPKPMVCLMNMEIQDIRFIGATKQHVKLTLKDDKSDTLVNAIGFSMAERFKGIQQGTMINVAGELSINEWQNRKLAQLMLKDIGIDGVHWLDYRGSQINPQFFNYQNAMYVFQNVALKEHYAPKLMTHSQVMTYHEPLDTTATTLVIVEPPANLFALATLLQQHPWQQIVMGAYIKESKYLSGEPTREEFAKLYRWLQKQPPFHLRKQLGNISQQLQLPLPKLKVMLHAFVEAKFIKVEEGIVTAIPPTESVDLFALPAIQSYRLAMKAEEMLVYQPIQTIKAYFENKKENII